MELFLRSPGHFHPFAFLHQPHPPPCQGDPIVATELKLQLSGGNLCKDRLGLDFRLRAS